MEDLKIADIFISYASEDIARAKSLAEALEKKRLTVWWDRKILPGETFDEVISGALSAAKCVIVLWSHASVKSSWVKEEADEAARRKILVPALIDDVEIPLGFRRIQAAQLKDWYREYGEHNTEYEKLLQSVANILHVMPTHISPEKPVILEPSVQPPSYEWYAELISKDQSNRELCIHLTRDQHIVEFKYGTVGIMNNYIVKVDGEVVGQGGRQPFTDTFKMDFCIADGSQQAPATIEVAMSEKPFQYIKKFRVTVGGHQLYEEG
jgi:hypothetical protein